MGFNEATNMNWIGISFTILIGFLLLSLPRKFAVVPIFLTACFMTFGQRINIAGINFFVLRILILIGCVRLVFRKEVFSFKLNAIDKAIVCWVISNVLIYTLLRQNSAAFINRLGLAYNVFGLYFLFRYLIRDFDDIERAFKILAIVSILFSFTIIYEYVTGRNFFSILGGVQKEFEIALTRQDRLRCMGSFGSPIITGIFGALLIPVSVVLWFRDGGRKIFAIGTAMSGTFIVIASGSSAPLMAYLCVVIWLLMWPLRMHMKAVRWGIFVALIAIHLYMKASVWFLMDRISGSITGGGGYHRSILIDKAIKHFDEWWLLGTDYTVHWTGRAITANPKMADITNAYIREGVNGGLITMILFIVVLALCFRSIGKALRIMENQPFAKRITLWSMEAMLFAHVVVFISVRYFDQMIVFWYLLLAMISTGNDLISSSHDHRPSRWLA